VHTYSAGSADGIADGKLTYIFFQLVLTRKENTANMGKKNGIL
jgi:hypothetical protein